MQSIEKVAENTTDKATKKRVAKSTKATAKTKKSATKTATENGVRKLKILITVVNRSKTEYFMDLLTDFEVNFQTTALAQGTATNETMHLLGLEDSDRSVIFSVLREDKAEEALHAIEDKFSSLRGGKGIAFTVPMSSVIGVAMYQFLSNYRPVTAPSTAFSETNEK